MDGVAEGFADELRLGFGWGHGLLGGYGGGLDILDDLGDGAGEDVEDVLDPVGDVRLGVLRDALAGQNGGERGGGVLRLVEGRASP